MKQKAEYRSSIRSKRLIRQAFVELVDRYYTEGFARLTENRPSIDAVSKNVISFLKENNGKDIPDFAPILKDTDK